MGYMKLMCFLLTAISVDAIAKDIYSGNDLYGFRAERLDVENGQTLFVRDRIAGKHIYVFEIAAKENTKISDVARKVILPNGIREFAQDVQCEFDSVVESASSKEKWKVFYCELVDNRHAGQKTWHE